MAKEILLADNFGSINLVEQSQLSADAAASQAVVVAKNAQGFATDDYVLVGNIGSERAELKKVLSVSNQDITLSSNLALPHTKDEAITKLRGNQVKFYRAANVDGSVPADGSFTNIATVSIEADQAETEYVDSVGGSGYWYKFTYYNDVSTLETSLSDAQAVRGGGYNRYATVAQVRAVAGLKTNKYIADADVLEAIEDAEDQVKSSLSAGGYTLPLSEIPLLIRYVTKQLAAGFLLTNSYGSQHAGTAKDGDKKIERATKILEKIETGKLSLIESSDDSTVSSGSVGIAGYPDDTAVDGYPSDGAKFTMSDVF